MRDCILGRYPSVWFSSADDSAAKEYIRYCVQWAGIFDAVINEGVIKKRNGQNAYRITFFNGSRITALSSNPKSFRSKGGKVCLDEFAHHHHQQELWKAARPVITWGYPVRILSTHNGKLNMFYDFLDQIRKGELGWSLHRTDINDALRDGLLEKILGRRVRKAEKDKWLDELRAGCADEYSWQEEYLCVPVDEATAFLTYDLITSCVAEQSASAAKEAVCALGIDIGRSHDLTVVWAMCRSEGLFLTKEVRVLRSLSFREQRREIEKMISGHNAIGVCIDSTGLGMQLGEELCEKYGERMVEKFVFTSKSKAEAAYHLKAKMQEGVVKFPADKEAIASLHSVTITHTRSGVVSIGAPRTESGHADHFWALALALRAAMNVNTVELKPRSGKLRLERNHRPGKRR